MRGICTFFLLLAACASLPPDANRIKPDHAPTPFSAEQIREGCRPGRSSTFLIETPLNPPLLQTFRFLDGDAEGVNLEISWRTPDSDEKPKVKKTRGSWKGFQSHASYPAAATRITQATLKTAAGTFDCWLYTVTTRVEGKTVVKRLHFAKNLPGPPVRRTQEEDGERVFAMTLIEHTDGR